MPALWKKCKRCRRVYRMPGRHGSIRNMCSYCPGIVKLHGIRRELADPIEAAWLVGGIEAAQTLATPGIVFPGGLG